MLTQGGLQTSGMNTPQELETNAEFRLHWNQSLHLTDRRCLLFPLKLEKRWARPGPSFASEYTRVAQWDLGKAALGDRQPVISATVIKVDAPSPPRCTKHSLIPQLSPLTSRENLRSFHCRRRPHPGTELSRETLQAQSIHGRNRKPLLVGLLETQVPGARVGGGEPSHRSH